MSWPRWGTAGTISLGRNDLDIGCGGDSLQKCAPSGSDATPGGEFGYCMQGNTFQGTDGEICGGTANWGDGRRGVVSVALRLLCE